MDKISGRAIGAGGSVVLSAGTGLATNIVTDRPSWAIAAMLVVLVASAVVVAIATTTRDGSAPPPPPPNASHLPVDRAQIAQVSGGQAQVAGRDVLSGVPAMYIVLSLSIVAVLVIAILLIVVAFGPGAGRLIPPRTAPNGPEAEVGLRGSPQSATTSPSLEGTAQRCGTESSPGTVEAEPAMAGGLVFCPTRINKGKMPITGPFDMNGQILGTRQARKDLVLLVRIDPSSCDATGHRGATGRFLLDADLEATEDGTWFHHDNLGGQKSGVTLGRVFEFVRAPTATVEAWKANKSRFKMNGITDLPDGVVILASFIVPPGKYAGALACRG